MLICLASLRSAPAYKNHATAPEFQLPVCCLLPAIWHWLGSWLTPARGCQAAMLPNGAVRGSADWWFPEQDQQIMQSSRRLESPGVFGQS